MSTLTYFELFSMYAYKLPQFFLEGGKNIYLDTYIVSYADEKDWLYSFKYSTTYFYYLLLLNECHIISSRGDIGLSVPKTPQNYCLVD